MRQALSTAIAGLAAGKSFTVLELAATRVTAFQVEIDAAGVPRASSHPGTGLSTPELAGDLFIVNSAPDAPDAAVALKRLRAAHPEAPVWTKAGADVGELVEAAIADAPIQRSHALLVARANPRTGHIKLALKTLFPEGARRGEVTELAVRTEATDAHGVVFAVVAWDGSTPALLSAESALLRPGEHHVTARLRQPGEVEFLTPAGLSRDPRSVADLLAAIPSSFERVERAHLICAIEVAGAAARVATRLDCAEKVIKAAHRQFPQPDRLRIGLLAYGGHRIGRRGRGRRGDRVIVTDWLAAPEDALKSLGWLGTTELGYPRAAQVEDMLAAVVRRLEAASRPPQTTLLVIGDRPPHPPAPDGEAVPCPHRHDWQRLLGTLELQPDVTLAAIRDQPGSPGGAAWARLGAAALKPLDTVDADAFGAQIGLVVPAKRRMPIPLID
ncbi:hypothetical protein [Nonomuraea sp. NPDC049028]|uniref:hypothetical protein n=1 Tax=Nonomuraea sp. NPDC049028 TaxID=3364348 RepID=UPI00371DAB00